MINRSLFILIIATLLFSSFMATAQFSMPDNTIVGTAKQYWVDSIIGSGSTYTWKIDHEIMQTGSVDLFSMVWNKEGKFFLEVKETSANNCEGEVKSGWINVTGVPILEMTGPLVDVACAVETVPGYSNLNAFLLAGGTINHSCALDSTSFTLTSEVISGSGYPDSYTITRDYSISDNCGNTATCTSVISVPGVLSVFAIPTHLTCDENSSGKIDITASGGTTPYTFVWSNGERNEDITGLGAGTYSLSVTDKNGCTITINTTIAVENSMPVADFIPNFVEIMTYSFHNTSSYAETYAWSFGNDQNSTLSDPMNTYADVGTYLVTLAVTNNCGTDETSQEITVTIPDVEFYNGYSPNDDGRNDYWEIPVLRYYPANKVKIINRWGSEVWKTDNYSNINNFWSGENLNGNNLPDGTYYYIINYGKVEKRGWVFIKR